MLKLFLNSNVDQTHDSDTLDTAIRKEYESFTLTIFTIFTRQQYTNNNADLSQGGCITNFEENQRHP